MSDADRLERLQLLLTAAQRTGGIWLRTMEELVPEDEDFRDLSAFTDFSRACLAIQTHIIRRIGDFYTDTGEPVPDVIINALVELQEIEENL
jgi:hypothetical protein